MSTAEEKARALGSDPVALAARLLMTVDCLLPQDRRRFKSARFDFEAKSLIGDGARLTWRMRRYPEQPEHYHNQQSSVGYVALLVEE